MALEDEVKKAEPKPEGQKPQPQFDADVGPYNPLNRKAAKARRLKYDSGSRVYRDEDGCPMRDEFGQPLG